MTPTPTLTDLATRRFLVADEDGRELSREVAWSDLRDANDGDTLAEIAALGLGDVGGIGHDLIQRVA